MTPNPPRFTQEEEAAGLRNARELIERGDKEGLARLEHWASAGSAVAMMMLGQAHEAGPFAHLPKAERWYRAADETYRSTSTSLRLGRFLFAQRRTDEAKPLFQWGAEEDDGLSMYWLAAVLLREAPSRERELEIRRLLERSSQQGYVYATRKLAELYMAGRFGIQWIPLGIALFLSVPISVVRIASKNRSDPRLMA